MKRYCGAPVWIMITVFVIGLLVTLVAPAILKKSHPSFGCALAAGWRKENR